jgi:hypothetical protein
MRRIFLLVLYGLFLTGSVRADIIASKIYVEKNPIPNMEEKYVPLKLVKTIGPEITSEVFLYKPQTLTVDQEGNLYVFDRGQHRIIQFDKNQEFVRFIGRDGQGPGEFVKAPGAGVFINAGIDNKLYCYDTAGFKIMVFDTKGNYITEYRTSGVQFHAPIVNGKGQLYFFSGNDNVIEAKSQNGETLFNVPVDAKEVYSFLFHKQYVHQNNFDGFLNSSFLVSGNLLLYFSNSCTMLVVSGKNNMKKYRILPKDLLADYKRRLKTLIEKEKFNLTPFSSIIPDGDVEGIYYLPYVINTSTNRSVLYKMNLEGELQKTYFIEYEKDSGALWVMAKKNNMFFAKKFGDEVIRIFKEEE